MSVLRFLGASGVPHASAKSRAAQVKKKGLRNMEKIFEDVVRRSNDTF